MKKIYEKVIPAKNGLAVEVKQGQIFRLIELEGKQAVDIVVFNLDNPREKLSASYSRTRYFVEKGVEYIPRNTVKEDDWLMSTSCRPMMTIIKETAEPKGVHDLHHRMCNRFFMNVYNGLDEDGCHEIISKAVAPYGITYEEIPDPINVFTNYPYDCKKNHFTILPPVTKPGDYIDFRAEMNCLVGLSNCPEDKTTSANDKKCKSIKVEIYEDETYKPKPILDHYEWLMRELSQRRGK